MSRLLGSHADVDELDRPDLNKCPDCKCFFASEKCPLCGKVCPEEMRAGNRKAEKKRRKRGGGSGRVTFVEWYHSWWFILIMMFTFTVVGIILLATSPRARWKKILFGSLAAVYMIMPYASFVYPGGIPAMVYEIKSVFDKPVNTSLSKEEYEAKCEYVTAEDFYRNPKKYVDKYLRLELTVVKKVWVYEDYYVSEEDYYLCESEDGRFTVLVRGCFVSGEEYLVEGDVISVYGEGAGQKTAFDSEGNEAEAPCLNGAYLYFTD